MKNLSIDDIQDQSGKIAIITGANTGLGYETTKFLVKKNMVVVMACRNLKKARTARESITRKNRKAQIEIMELDLSSLNSVKAFTEKFIENHERLDVLVNNAGLMIPPYQKTEDGFESQFGVNYLGHFLLTQKLFPLLKKSGNSRIVSLSSIAHKNAQINFEDINWEKKYSRSKAYGQSKLACLMFAYELQRRIEKSNLKIKSLAAHPGISDTELFRYIPGFLTFILKPFTFFISHSAEKGARPEIIAATHPSLKGGEYIGPTGFKGMKGKPGVVGSSPYSYDEKIADELWNLSEKMTQTKFSV
ncbi:oxidoreductase [Gramella sp. AN32]|uniref:Oxidoreductase n=1 Tax=Christiangramia antarctica TaxID=2058158 RepID=A0ABW5X1R5_9FLAO|nr:oxidoreductase [Gramella sp. AN32]MCM4156839.1 short-chain dehydrogenase [Gramella sp. AN32]